MKLLLALLAVGTLTVTVEAIGALVYLADNCNGAAAFDISKVPDKSCISLHSNPAGTTFALTSAKLSCDSLTSGSAWTADVWITVAGQPSSGNYMCTGSPISTSPPIAGTGTGCVTRTLGVAQVSVQIDCGQSSGSTTPQSAGGVDFQIDPALPFALNLGPAGSIAAGKYLRVSYSKLGEVTINGNTVTNVADTNTLFHSIPLNDIVVTSNINAYSSNADDRFAFAGYVGPVPQYYPFPANNAFGLSLNLLAKKNFGVTSYPVPLPGLGTTNVCFRGTATACTPLQITTGTIKSSVGLFNWTYAGTATHFRVQYLFQIVPSTDTYTVFFNGDAASTPPTFPAQVDSITYQTGNTKFVYNVQQTYNKGDNKFATARITASGTASALTLNVDIPLAGLATSGWWLYDPDIQVTGAASIAAPSMLLLVGAVAWLAALFA